MLVGAAQCNLVCRGGSVLSPVTLDMCCCREVGYGIRTSCRSRPDSDQEEFQRRCPGTPRLDWAKPGELQIVCGEHSLLFGAPNTYDSKEVALSVTEVINHPQFDIGLADGPKEGPYGGFDIAVYKVRDSVLKAKMERRKLWPACLPKPESSYANRRGLWVGWDLPDRRNRTQNIASYTAKEYIASHLPSQIQLEKVACEDPAWMGSDTFYPAGTQCFQDPTFFSCFDYGNGGSGVVRKLNTLDGTDR